MATMLRTSARTLPAGDRPTDRPGDGRKRAARDRGEERECGFESLRSSQLRASQRRDRARYRRPRRRRRRCHREVESHDCHFSTRGTREAEETRKERLNRASLHPREKTFPRDVVINYRLISRDYRPSQTPGMPGVRRRFSMQVCEDVAPPRAPGAPMRDPLVTDDDASPNL